jgi:hypothetical protein
MSRTSAGARGETTDQVTFDFLDVRGGDLKCGNKPNFPMSCELAESPATAVPLYYDDDNDECRPSVPAACLSLTRRRRR